MQLMVCLEVQKVSGSFFESVANLGIFKVTKTAFLNGQILTRFQQKKDSTHLQLTVYSVYLPLAENKKKRCFVEKLLNLIGFFFERSSPLPPCRNMYLQNS